MTMWKIATQQKPMDNSEVLMAWEDAIQSGKYFDIGGFAVKKGSHYVYKIGVKCWCYVEDMLQETNEILEIEA